MKEVEVGMAVLRAPGRPGKVAEVSPAIAAGDRFGVSRDSIELEWASVRFVVADGWESVSEGHEIEWMVEGVPAYRLKSGELTTMVCSDLNRNAVVMKVRYEGDGRVFLLVTPRESCDAWIDGERLFARAGERTLVVGSGAPFRKMSLGYAGVSDALTDIHRHKEMTEVYSQAVSGNIVMAAEIDLHGTCTLVVGASTHDVEASEKAGFDYLYDEYVKGWKEAQRKFLPLGESDPALRTMYRISTAALLSSREENAALAWGFLAAGDMENAVRIFLDLEGEPAETILLADALRRDGRLPDTLDIQPFVKRAVRELVESGERNAQALLVGAEAFSGDQARFLRELASSSGWAEPQPVRKETTTGPTWGGQPALVAEYGTLDEAKMLLDTLIAQAGPVGFLPERIWEGEDQPDEGLLNGQPMPGPMPFIPAHVAFIRLLRSLEEGKVWNGARQHEAGSKSTIWHFGKQFSTLHAGEALRIQTRSPALVRWSFDLWDRHVDNHTVDSGFGVHYVDLPTQTLKPGSRIVFTLYWTEVEAWEGLDHFLDIFSR